MFILFSSALALLSYNKYSKGKFEISLDMIKNEKSIKMNFSYSRLCLLMLFNFANTPDSFWKNFTINIPLTDNNALHLFLRDKLNQTINGIHNDIVSFSLN